MLIFLTFRVFYLLLGVSTLIFDFSTFRPTFCQGVSTLSFSTFRDFTRGSQPSFFQPFDLLTGGPNTHFSDLSTFRAFGRWSQPSFYRPFVLSNICQGGLTLIFSTFRPFARRPKPSLCRPPDLSAWSPMAKGRKVKKMRVEIPAEWSKGRKKEG